MQLRAKISRPCGGDATVPPTGDCPDVYALSPRKSQSCQCAGTTRIVEKAAYPAAVDKRPLGATLATGMPLAPSPGPNGGVADSLDGGGGKALVLFIVVGLLPPNGG